MTRRTLKIVVVGALVLAGMTTSFMIHHKANARFRERDVITRQQSHQLIELLAEQQRLSNLVAQAKNSLTEDRTAELEKLRGEAEKLRKQISELAKRSAPQSATSKLSPIVRNAGSAYVVSDSSTEEYATQLYRLAAGERNRHTSGARNLSRAIRAYAREHQGQVPSSFDEAAPYQWKGELPLVGTNKDRDTVAGVNDFEIVFHGSLQELAGIPEQAVALLRQRQPWPTPAGKWARIYTMADGRVYVVESDDNFQSWEAKHIIPRPGER